jgi:succinate-semialdehyde dehydrogenase / glutarate-semialdehyde dehydrogenase
MISHDLRTDIYIDGQWQTSSDGSRFDVQNPATEMLIANVADGTELDAAACVDAAARAQPLWARMTPRVRGEILREAYERFIDRKEWFAEIITRENGKSLSDSRAEVAYAADFFRWYSEEAVRNIGQISMAPSSGARILAQHKAAGVAVLITPWNFPAAMGTRKIAPALAAGCSVILKPATETPLTMLALAQLLHDSGVPAGVVNILPSRRSGAVVNAMLKDPRVRVVSFTGSTQVGRSLLGEAAKSVVNPRMELGGNAPFIVFEDADIEAAVAGAMIAKMRNMGEACTAANRFYVHDAVYDEFVERFGKAMGALKVGNGLDEGVTVGPLVNKKALQKVASLVDDATSRGARVVVGGMQLPGRGFFYAPTVLADVVEGSECLTQEIFGPVAPVQRFSTEEEAVARANQSEYGLAAYIYTRDLARGLRVSECIESGMIGLNRGVVSDPAAPFGGVKQSGLGREGGHEGLMEFLETQYISVAW